MKTVNASYSLLLVPPFTLTALALSASAQVYHVQEMSTMQIQGLDRSHTAVFLVGGILEEHGPTFLPTPMATPMNTSRNRSLTPLPRVRDGKCSCSHLYR
jgi:hypothetical protein